MASGRIGDTGLPGGPARAGTQPPAPITQRKVWHLRRGRSWVARGGRPGGDPERLTAGSDSGGPRVCGARKRQHDLREFRTDLVRGISTVTICETQRAHLCFRRSAAEVASRAALLRVRGVIEVHAAGPWIEATGPEQLDWDGQNEPSRLGKRRVRGAFSRKLEQCALKKKKSLCHLLLRYRYICLEHYLLARIKTMRTAWPFIQRKADLLVAPAIRTTQPASRMNSLPMNPRCYLFTDLFCAPAQNGLIVGRINHHYPTYRSTPRLPGTQRLQCAEILGLDGTAYSAEAISLHVALHEHSIDAKSGFGENEQDVVAAFGPANGLRQTTR